MTTPQFTISLFENVGNTRPLVKTCSWGGFCMGLTKPKVRADKDGQLFSPARYQGNRRLQTNVIDLSMLVLEIDGAWRCVCCGHAGPHVMFVSNRVKDDAGRVDRSPRCPACLKAKCPKCWEPGVRSKESGKKTQPRVNTTLEPIEFTFASVLEGMRRAFPGNAFAVYSTHSHQRVTAVVCGKDVLCKPECCRSQGCGAIFGHEAAEPCYRLIVPLASPVPVADFPALWLRAVNSLHESEVIADPQAKDPNRIFYTPVKASDVAAYEYHVEPGHLFDWNKNESLHHANQLAAADDVSLQHGPHSLHQSGVVGIGCGIVFQTHEDLNEELGRRIAARGKQNTRGHFDAKCLAHNGRGNSSLVYFPETNAVQCNAGCGFWDIVASEGLPELHLPTRAQLAVNEARAAVNHSSLVTRHLSLERPLPLELRQLHLIYVYLLSHLFELSAEHEAQIRRDWPNAIIFSQDEELSAVEWWGANESNIATRPVKICSMPNSVQVARAVAQLSEWGFDLREVPGFFVEVQTQRPHAPSTEFERARWQSQNFGQWRMNLTSRKGLLVPAFDEAGWLYSIQIYQSTKDRNPTLLTSRGLPGGAKALTVKERVA